MKTVLLKTNSWVDVLDYGAVDEDAEAVLPLGEPDGPRQVLGPRRALCHAEQVGALDRLGEKAARFSFPGKELRTGLVSEMEASFQVVLRVRLGGGKQGGRHLHGDPVQDGGVHQRVGRPGKGATQTIHIYIGEGRHSLRVSES